MENPLPTMCGVIMRYLIGAVCLLAGIILAMCEQVEGGCITVLVITKILSVALVLCAVLLVNTNYGNK